MEFTVCAPAGDYAAFDRVYCMAMALLDPIENALKEAVALTSKECASNIREFQYGLDMSKPFYFSILVTNREIVVTMIDGGKAWCEDGYYTDPTAEAKMLALAEEMAMRGRGHLIIAMLTRCNGSFQYKNKGRVRILAWRRISPHLRSWGMLAEKRLKRLVSIVPTLGKEADA